MQQRGVSMSEKKTLTPKQERFVAEYLIDLNATQAAIRAGYSAKNADQTGPRLLGNVGIAEAIRAKQTKRLDKIDLTADMVIRGLLAEANGEGPDTTSKDRVNAWQVLAKHLGMLIDKQEISFRTPDEALDYICQELGVDRSTVAQMGHA